MPIQENPIELQPLAQLAGAHVGNLGLPVADWGAYGRNYANQLLGQQQLQEQYAGLQSQQKLANIQGQYSLGGKQLEGQYAFNRQQNQQTFDAQQNQNKNAIDIQRNLAQQAQAQAQLAQTGAYQQGQLQVGQGRNDAINARTGSQMEMRQQELDQADQHWQQDMDMKKAQFTLKQAADMKDEDLKTMGSFSSVALSMLQEVPPEQRAALIPTIMDHAQDKFNLSDQEVKQVQSVAQNEGQFEQFLAAHAMIAGKALDLKSNPLQMKAVNQSTQINSQQAVGSINSRLRAGDDISQATSNLPTDLFTGGSKGKEMAAGALNYLGFPNAANAVSPSLNEAEAAKTRVVGGMSAAVLAVMDAAKKAGRFNPAMQTLYQNMIPTHDDMQDNVKFWTKVEMFKERLASDNMQDADLITDPKQKQALMDKTNDFVTNFKIPFQLPATAYGDPKFMPKDMQTTSSPSNQQPQMYTYKSPDGRIAHIPAEHIADLAKQNKMSVQAFTDQLYKGGQ